MFPVAHGRRDDADGVVRGPSSTAADGDEGAETGVEDDDELQDGVTSKRRRLAGRDGRGRPLLPPPVDPDAQVPVTAASEPAGEEGRDESVVEEARVPRVRPDPEKPTARERLEHNISHDSYLSWCRHCTRDRGATRPLRKRSEEDREFSKGRVPTISLDHCFLGSEDQGPDGAAVPALENPFLIMYDADLEAIYCLPVASKAVTDYVVHCAKSVVDELGYSELRIALKSDAAPELK